MSQPIPPPPEAVLAWLKDELQCATYWCKAGPAGNGWNAWNAPEKPGMEARRDWLQQVLAVSESAKQSGIPQPAVTAAMVRQALDEHVQYLVPTTDLKTPYHLEVQKALEGIANHLNASLNANNPARGALDSE